MEENKYMQFVRVSDEITELYIYGDIKKPGLFEKLFGVEDDTRVDAMTFAEKLDSIDTPQIVVRINSYGGSVSEGLAIYNQLKNCDKKIVTVVDGFACSAASIIYCAGEVRRQPKTSLLMIHNAWTYGGEGNANQFRKLADDLDKITQPSVEAYKAVANISEEKIKELMDAETWLTADEALEYGFTSEIPSDEHEQSISSAYIFNMVTKMKKASCEKESLEAKMEALKNELNNAKEELLKCREELQNESIPANSWKNFF